MKHRQATDYQTERRFLDIVEQISDSITYATGDWAGKSLDERMWALQGVKAVMDQFTNIKDGR